MRIRCKPWAKPELEACPFYISDPKACKGMWQAQFPKQQPLRLELGCRQGRLYFTGGSRKSGL